MNTTVQHETYGTIVYEEGFWSGKKSVTINGTPLTKTDKTHYRYDTNGASETVEVKGSTLTGVTLTIKSETIRLIEKPAWYVLALSILMFAFVIVWGNSPTLVNVFPIVGGAIGGLVSGVCAILNVIFAGKVKNAGFKILVGLGFFAATLLVCYGIAAAILSAAAAA